MIVKLNKKFVEKTAAGEIITTEIGYFAAEEMDEIVLPIVLEFAARMDEENLASFTFRDITKNFQIGNVKLNRILNFLEEEGFLRRVR